MRTAKIGPDLRLQGTLVFRKSQQLFGPKKMFYFCLIKVSVILKMISCNYQLMKQNWPGCELGTVVLFNWFWLQNLLLHPKSYKIASIPAHADSPLSEFPFRCGFSRNGVGKLAAAQGLFLILVRHSFLNAGGPGCSKLDRNQSRVNAKIWIPLLKLKKNSA